jgi:hypothetical protein
MFCSLPLSLAILLSISTDVFAAPNPHVVPRGQSINLHRRSKVARSPEDWDIWAKNHKAMLESKYADRNSDGQPQKRASGTNLLANQNGDSSFFGSLAIGTPPVSYNVILDTGSSDLWVADSNCATGCRQVPTFDAKSSTSFKNSSSSFSITYGSGQAKGVLAQDVIQMAGFSVPNQVFAVCDAVSQGLLMNPVSGLLGLGWKQIASSGATPLWQTLAESGQWDQPVMAFQLTRYGDNPQAQALEPGGSFTMGFLNNSLYTGDIDFQNIPSGQESYWILPMTGLTVRGNNVAIPTGPASFSAIDTGTTLVGGPKDAIAAIYAQIPGSQPGTGNSEGFYTYPCDTSVDVSLTFGGKSWPISPADFKMTQLNSGMCVGAFFALQTGGSAPNWIVGDTFLKNVYSVYRFNPPSVGFAALSNAAKAQNGAGGSVPSPTIGAVATVSASRSPGKNSNGATSSRSAGWGVIAFMAMMGAMWM